MIDDFNGGRQSNKKPVFRAAKKLANSGFTSEDLSKEFATVSFDAPKQKFVTQPVALAVEEASPDDVETIAEDNVQSKKRFSLAWPTTKRAKILASIAVVLVFFGAGAGWTLTHHKRTVVAATKAVPVVAKPKPTPIYSNLSGVAVTDASVNQKPVTGVMIENSLDARPQSGLSQAGVVFEAVAEGGVTRFLALYQDQVPTNVGPIRSARPYYVSWDQGFDAAYAHVGGSPDGLADITAWGVKDLNQFYNGNAYHRVTSRAAPHNVYTGIDTLNQLEASKGFSASTYAPFARKADQPYVQPTTPAPGTTTKPARTPAADARAAAATITMSLSGPTYDPTFAYDTASNSYKRSEAGAPQIDANTNVQLSPKVVIAIILPLEQGALDASGAYYSNYNVLGTGQALVFQDGTVTTAQWSKADNKTNISFSDANGTPLQLNRGQTWISAVTGLSKVSYK